MRTTKAEFVRADDSVIAIADIVHIDTRELEDKLTITVLTYDSLTHVATNLHALELLMKVLPSALEGRPKIKWPRHVWALHNLVAHPLMQLFAFFKLYDIAFYIHDVTVPTPSLLRGK